MPNVTWDGGQTPVDRRSNAAQIASLLHVLEHGPTGPVASQDIHAAANIVRWHLKEARQLLADDRHEC